MRQTWITTIQDREDFVRKRKGNFQRNFSLIKCDGFVLVCVWVWVYWNFENICTPFRVSVYTYILLHCSFGVFFVHFFRLHIFFSLSFYLAIHFHSKEANIIVSFCFHRRNWIFPVCGLREKHTMKKRKSEKKRQRPSWMVENGMQNRKLIDKSSLVSNNR